MNFFFLIFHFSHFSEFNSVCNPPYLIEPEKLDEDHGDPLIAMLVPRNERPTLFYEQALESIEKHQIRSPRGGALVLEVCRKNAERVVTLVRGMRVYKRVCVHRDEGGYIRAVEALW